MKNIQSFQNGFQRLIFQISIIKTYFYMTGFAQERKYYFSFTCKSKLIRHTLCYKSSYLMPLLKKTEKLPEKNGIQPYLFHAFALKCRIYHSKKRGQREREREYKTVYKTFHFHSFISREHACCPPLAKEQTRVFQCQLWSQLEILSALLPGERMAGEQEENTQCCRCPQLWTYLALSPYLFLLSSMR